MPMLGVTCSERPSSRYGAATTSSTFLATTATRLMAASSGMTMTNSSPPKLVAAQPRHRLGLAQHLRQALGELLEQAVADVVSERIVDQLEVIEIEEQYRHVVVIAFRLGNGLTNPIVEQGAVRQLGQRIVVGKEVDILLPLLALTDVQESPGVMRHFAARIANGPHCERR